MEMHIENTVLKITKTQYFKTVSYIKLTDVSEFMESAEIGISLKEIRIQSRKINYGFSIKRCQIARIKTFLFKTAILAQFENCTIKYRTRSFSINVDPGHIQHTTNVPQQMFQNKKSVNHVSFSKKQRNVKCIFLRKKKVFTRITQHPNRSEQLIRKGKNILIKVFFATRVIVCAKYNTTLI